MNKNRKGFTIVELVIVIAIIAILAAVLIPTFASLIQKANISKDTQVIRNLNTAIATATEKPETMRDALKIAAEAGYLVDKINAAANGNDILWDSENKVFCYMNAETGAVAYIPETKVENAKVAKYQFWKIYDEKHPVPEADKQTYSVYWAGTAAPNVTAYKVGFDAGNCTEALTITYTNTTAGQDVMFYMNGGKLTVEDTNDNNQQYFYGSLAEAVVKTGKSCFHAYGTIAKLDLQAGKVVAEAGSIVMVSNAAPDTEVKKSSGSVVMKTSGASIDSAAKFEESSKEEKSAYVLEISDAAGLAAFRDSVNEGMTYADLTVKLTADIDLSTQGNWNPIGNRYALNDGTVKDTVDGADYRKAFKGTFDGQGHTISGMFIDSNAENYKGTLKAGKDTSSYAALFGCIDGATLKNFTVKGTVLGTDVAGVVGITGATKCTVEQITSYVNLNGKVGTDGEGLVRGKVTGIVNCPKGKLVVSDCTNYGDLAVDGTDCAGGIIAYIGNELSVEIKNCNNYGAILATSVEGNKGCSVGGIVGVDDSNTTYENCNNYGEITGSARVGGIAGASKGSFNTCCNQGKIKTIGESAGGIAGFIRSNGNAGNTLTNCKNSGSVTAESTQNGQNANAGGLVGYAHCNTNEVTVTFTNCENTSKSISGNAGNVGEIIGCAWYDNNVGYKVVFTSCKGVDNKALIGTSSASQVKNN